MAAHDAANSVCAIPRRRPWPALLHEGEYKMHGTTTFSFQRRVAHRLICLRGAYLVTGTHTRRAAFLNFFDAMPRKILGACFSNHELRNYLIMLALKEWELGLWTIQGSNDFADTFFTRGPRCVKILSTPICTP